MAIVRASTVPSPAYAGTRRRTLKCLTRALTISRYIPASTSPHARLAGCRGRRHERAFRAFDLGGPHATASTGRPHDRAALQLHWSHYTFHWNQYIVSVGRSRL